MVWFVNPTAMFTWAKELYYGPMCQEQDFLCRWTEGAHKLNDVPANILQAPISPQFLKAMLTGGVLVAASAAGVSPLVTKGSFWLYLLAKTAMQAQVSAEAGWLSMNYLTANVVGHYTQHSTLAFLAACAVDVAYNAYCHPAALPAVAANMLVGYVGFYSGSKIIKMLDGEDSKTAPINAPPVSKKRRR